MHLEKLSYDAAVTVVETVMSSIVLSC